MVDKGVTTTGFGTALFDGLYEQSAALWYQLTGKRLREFKPEDDLIRSVLILLSNEDISDPGVTRDPALWQVLSQVFYASYLGHARNRSLDFVGRYRDRKRYGGTKSTGYLTFTSEEPGVAIPLGLQLKKPSDETIVFKTTQAGVTPVGLSVVLPVQAAAVGDEYNTAAGAMAQEVENLLPDVVTVTNLDAAGTLELTDGDVDAWSSVNNTETQGFYQTVVAANIQYPMRVTDVSIQVHNPEETPQIWQLQLIAYDDDDGAELDRSTMRQVSLAGDEEDEFVFSNLFWDLSGHDNVRFAIINSQISDGPIEIGVSEDGDGGWHEGGEVVEDTDAVMVIESGIAGEISGGTDVETDEEYTARLRQVLHNAAGGTPNGLYSKLKMLPGMRGVRIIPNPDSVALDYGQGLTIPAHRMAVVVDGVIDLDQVAQTIAETGCGWFSYGNIERDVILDNGEENKVALFVAETQDIEVLVRLETKQTFPSSGGYDMVKDVIISYIGGATSSGQLRDGLNVGEPVSHAHLVAAVMRVPGIRFADVRLAISGQELAEADVFVGALKKAYTSLDLVSVVGNAR